MSENLSQPIIKIENLSVVYNKGTPNEFWALRDVSLSIYPKEYVIFFGPSGCGKSTLLNSIAGLETNITGKVTVRDKELVNMSEDDIAKFHRESMGMVFQQYNLIPSLSVIDNVTLPQVFLNTSKNERVEKAKVLLEKFGILKQADKIPSELSGGQQQRIGIARALINDPMILLADEAVGNLDSASALVVMDLLKKLNTEEGKTLIAVTHNPEHLFYANRIFYIKDGKILKEVVNNEIRPQEVYKEEEKNKKEEEKGLDELQLLMRSFSGLSTSQVRMLLVPFKAKMLSAYLLKYFESDEINRIEHIISERLLEKLNETELRSKLDQDYKIGGAGLNSKTAERLGKAVEGIIRKTELIIGGKKQKDPNGAGMGANLPDFNSFRGQIAELRQGLINSFHIALNDRQIARMEMAIYNRLTGKIDKRVFSDLLDRSFDKGGVGLNKVTAKKIARELEMVMLLTYGMEK